MPSIRQECDSCRGTGLYSGFCEPKGTAVVCLSCEGRGWVNHAYKEFKGRKKLAGITKINRSRGAFIGTGVGATGASMTYAEFEKAHKA